MRVTVRGLAGLSLSLLSITLHAAPVDDARARGIAYLIDQQASDVLSAKRFFLSAR